MSTACPYCTRENTPQALVCGSCSREITLPPSLIAERDELAGKRDALRRELENAKAELEVLRQRQRKQRSS